MSKKYNESQYLATSILDDYMQEIEHDSIKDLISKLPVLKENGKAFSVEGEEYLAYPNVSKSKLYVKFISKYDKKMVKKNCRKLYDYEFGSKGHTSANEHPKIIELAKYAFDYGTYITKIDDKNYGIFVLNKSDEMGYLGVKYQIWFVGSKKYYKKYYNLYNQYMEYIKSTSKEYIQYTDGRSDTETVFKDFSKVVFTEKKNILAYIDNFINNIPKYHSYGVVPKLSVMIYGEPGTGKSTFAKALAKYLKVNKITSVSAGYFSQTISNDNKRNGFRRYYDDPTDSIWVLDDCDCICKDRNVDKSQENAKILANLLSFLDNPPTFDFEANDGKIYPISVVVATTNYYDKLDAAVKRYGRFDLTIEMKEFTRNEAEEMCKIYDLELKDIVTDEDINNKKFHISPSKLQSMCLENLDKSMKNVE